MANDSNYVRPGSIMDALFYAAKGSTSDYMAELCPPENEETRETWKQLCASLDKLVPDKRDSGVLTDAIIEYGQAVEWHFFINGVRLAMHLVSEFHSLSFI